MIVNSNKMNKNSRMLPQLNVTYLQKKAYDLHRKKIDYIKHSLTLTQQKVSENIKQSSQSKNKLQFASKDKMSTIHE